MSTIWKMKRGDTSPAIRVKLLHSGYPVDLTGASVWFCFRGSKRPCTILDASGGEVEYSWQPTDTATSGTFQAEIEVVYSNGKVETFPNDDYLKILIMDDIA